MEIPCMEHHPNKLMKLQQNQKKNSFLAKVLFLLDFNFQVGSSYNDLVKKWVLLWVAR